MRFFFWGDNNLLFTLRKKSQIKVVEFESFRNSKYVSKNKLPHVNEV
jgi:hypothetical protein